MRYKNGEYTTLIGNLLPGRDVTITLIDIREDTLLDILTHECHESAHIPGAYLWDTSNLVSAPSGEDHINCMYQMTDGNDIFQGKFVIGGYLDEIATQVGVDETIQKVEYIINNLNEVSSIVTEIQNVNTDEDVGARLTEVSNNLVNVAGAFPTEREIANAVWNKIL